MNFTSATDLLTALRQKRLSSVELVDATIKHIEATDPTINAVVVRDFERASQAARAADQGRKAGEDRPLLGLPITVKEAFDVAGLPTTWGLVGRHKPAGADAVVVERLRAAGAVILGKTNLATMLADWQSANPVFGTTNNPWNAGRTAGGSSGGGTAAVAAAMSPLDIGSDLSGSLRIPAAFCGVFAHRPSHGIVPMRGFAPPMAPRGPFAQVLDQATLGTIGRSTADLKLALDVIAGADAPAATGWRLALPRARHQKLGCFRILALTEHPLVATSEQIQSAIGAVVDRLARSGCRIERSAHAAPDMADLSRTFGALLMALTGVDIPAEDYADAAERIAAGKASAEKRSMTISHRDWMLLDRHRLALAAAWRETFRDFDVVLCPAAPTTAFAHDSRPFPQRWLDVDGTRVGYDKMPLWCSLAAPAGLPVTAVPVGTDRDGLPIGMQVIGPRLEDHTPLAFAALLEAELGCGFVAPPKLH